MRQKRAKSYRKLMHLYCLSFGFRRPYQVLVDSTMCRSAIEYKIELSKQLATVLQGDVKPMITQCCIHELYIAGKFQQPAVDLAKTFERRKCNHREPIPGDDCMVSVIGDANKHRYVVATQSQPLRVLLRGVPGVPIVHVNRSVTILEPPSDVTLRHKALTEDQAQEASTSERALVAPVDGNAPPPRKKRKGPKGPNPLSVKKKKAVPPAALDKGKVKPFDLRTKGVDFGGASSATAAEKRKWQDDDEDGDVDGDKKEEGAGGRTSSVPEAEAGRKRKRKRKGAAVTVANTAASVGIADGPADEGDS